MLAMGAPDTLSGQADLLPRSAQEPIDVAFRPLRRGLDAIIATLMDVPDATTELAEAVMTRQAMVQDVAVGLHRPVPAGEPCSGAARCARLLLPGVPQRPAGRQVAAP